MRGLLADINLIGPVRLMVSDHLLSPLWQEIWMALNLAIVTFADLGLSPNTSDAEVWRRCQQERLGLLTGNRNKDGPDSLEATIQAHNTPNSLPVFTIANVHRMSKSNEYRARIAERLLEYLLEIDAIRGVGRIYLP